MNTSRWAVMAAWAAENEGAGGGEAVPVVAPAGAEPVAPTAPAGEAETKAEGAEPAAPVTEEETKPPAPAPDAWKDRRIAQLTAKLAEAKRAPVQAEQGSGETDAAFEARVAEEADRRARTSDFNTRCNDAVAKGKEAFGAAFDTSVDSLKKIVDVNDPASVGAYNQFLLAALETGEAAKLIHVVGSDLNEAMRIMSLPPLTMAVELTRLAGKDIKEVSAAPKPIVPVGGKGAVATSIDPDDAARADHLSTAEWMARRNAQVEARRGR